MEAFTVIDADGHVTESEVSLKKYLPKEYQSRRLFSSPAWDRTFGGKLGKRNGDPKIQLADDMDAGKINIQVIYPSHLSLSAAREPDVAVDIARAYYNDWLAEFCSVNPNRLKGVAMVALQDVDCAVKEARRAVEELGFIGVMMPTNVRDHDIGGREF